MYVHTQSQRSYNWDSEQYNTGSSHSTQNDKQLNKQTPQFSDKLKKLSKQSSVLINQKKFKTFKCGVRFYILSHLDKE